VIARWWRRRAGRAAIGAAFALALAGAGPACTKGDRDSIDDAIHAAAEAEAAEMLEVAIEVVPLAIRAGADAGSGAGFGPLALATGEGETFVVSGSLSFSGSGPVAVEGEIVVERGAEHAIDVHLEGVLVDSLDLSSSGGAILGGELHLHTEAHLEPGGGRGAHGHGAEEGAEGGGGGEGGEEAEANAFAVALDLVLPTGPGAFGVLSYRGARPAFPAEEPMEEVPAP
jgi:hypothetical protein